MRRFPYWHETILLGLLAALLVAAQWLDPAFLKAEAQIGLAEHAWDLALLALPMTLIIITAGIDLSVGSTMALSAVVLGLAYSAGIPMWAAGAFAILTGLAAGAVNGLFVAWARVHPLIVTLATLAAYRGIAEGISKGAPVSGFPEGFQALASGTIAGLPIPGALFVIAAAATALILAKSPLGRSLYAIGHNETASRYSGIPVDRIKMHLYSLAGAIAGLTAVLYVARRNTAKADIGVNMELDVITAVVLGGASIFGGRGNIVGTLLGVLLIHETREFVSWHWMKDELNLIVIGALLIGSVLLNRVLTRKGRAEE